MKRREPEPGPLLPLVVGFLFSVGTFMRLVDAALLARRPRLLRAYLATWRTAFVKTPWSEGSFDKHMGARRRHKSLVELTYGETPVTSAVSVLRAAGVDRDARVLDLGCGRGRVLIAARYLGAHATGIELLEDHVEQTRVVLARIGACVQLGDAEDPPLEGATHVYLAWTCFTPETRARIERALRERLAEGARVIAMNHPLASEGFVEVARTTALCSWGRVPVTVHEKQRAPRVTPS